MQLREMRKTLGMTQQQFADEIGVHVRTIRNWEREGASVPQKEGYRVYELFFGANDEATEEAEERDGWAGWMRGALRVRQWTVEDLGRRTKDRIPPRRLVEILRGSVPDDEEVDALASALQVERESVARVSGALRDLSSYSDRELLLELLRRESGESSSRHSWPSFIPAPPGTPDVPAPLDGRPAQWSVGSRLISALKDHGFTLDTFRDAVLSAGLAPSAKVLNRQLLISSELPRETLVSYLNLVGIDPAEFLGESDNVTHAPFGHNVPTSRDTIDHVETPDLEHLDYAASRGTRKADEAPWAE